VGKQAHKVTLSGWTVEDSKVGRGQKSEHQLSLGPQDQPRRREGHQSQRNERPLQASNLETGTEAFLGEDPACAKVQW
jgi:hypothetical protein